MKARVCLVETLRSRIPFALRYRSARLPVPVRPEPVDGASLHFSPFGLSLSKALLVGSVEGPCLDVSSRVSPRRASHLSCLPKKVDPKKGTPTSAVRLQRTALRCSDFGARAELALFAALTALEQPREVSQRRRFAPRQSPALLDASHGARRATPATPRCASAWWAMRSEPCRFP